MLEDHIKKGLFLEVPNDFYNIFVSFHGALKEMLSDSELNSIKTN